MSRRLSFYRYFSWNAADQTQLSSPGLGNSPFALLNLRTHSSHEWLERQRRDPYVKKAKYESYRARSAFKLLEMDEKYRIFRPGQIVLDLGAAPGSWCQVAVKAVNAVIPSELETGGSLPRMVIRERDRTQRYYDGDADLLQAAESTNESAAQSKRKTGLVIGVDLLPIAPLPGAIVLAESDFTDPKTQQTIRDLLKGQAADVVLCDMAPNASGMKSLDHDMIMSLCRTALVFSLKVLADNGTFLCKIWNGEGFKAFSDDLKKCFKLVRNVKPPASRDDSAELYLLASGFQKSTLTTNKTSPVYCFLSLVILETVDFRITVNGSSLADYSLLF